MKTFYIDTPTFLWDKENEKIITDQERNINVWFYEMGEIKLTDQFAIDDFFKIHQDEYVVFYMNKDSIYHYKNDEKYILTAIISPRYKNINKYRIFEAIISPEKSYFYPQIKKNSISDKRIYGNFCLTVEQHKWNDITNINVDICSDYYVISKGGSCILHTFDEALKVINDFRLSYSNAIERYKIHDNLPLIDINLLK